MGDWSDSGGAFSLEAPSTRYEEVLPTELPVQSFVERHRGAAKPLEGLGEVPRAQRRSLAKPLSELARRYPDRSEAMAWAFRTVVYTMQEIAAFRGVHYSTVSRAVRRFQARPASAANVRAKA